MAGCAVLPLLPIALAVDPPGDATPAPGAEVVIYAPVDGAAQAAVTVVPLGPDQAGLTDLAGALETIPGTTVRRLGGLGDFAAVRLRGSTFQQVEIFLDGVPLNPNGDAVIDLSTLPVATFSDMLVYRGFAPAKYGSAAMGGVIDLRTGASSPTAIGVSGGSWGTIHTWGVSHRELGKTDALFTFDQLHTDGNWPYFDDQGTDFNRFDDRTPIREHNRIDRASGIARVRTRATPGVTLSVMDVPTWTSSELTGTISNPSTEATWTSARNLLVLDGDLRSKSAVRVSPRAWWLYRDETVNDPAGELALAPSWSRGVWNTGGAQIDTVIVPAPWLTTSLLVRGRQEDYRPFNLLEGEENGDGHRIRRGGTAALSANASFKPVLGLVTLSPVIQLDVIDNHLLGDVPFENMPVSPDSDDLAVFVLPRGALSWNIVGPLSLRGSGGLYARAPEMTELFGDQGVIVGNTDLVAETGFGLEAGVRVDPTRLGPLTVGADAGYARQRVHDLITYVPNSQQTEHAVNLGEAYLRTLEGALQLGLDGTVGGVHLGVASSSTATHLLTRNLDTNPTYSNNQLPNTAPLDVSQATTLTLAANYPHRLVLSHIWSYTGATFLDEANLMPSSPRDLHAVTASVRVARDFPTVEAAVHNLFDVRGMAVDRNPLDPADDTLVVKPLTDFVGYPLPGRTVMVTVRWKESPKE